MNANRLNRRSAARRRGLTMLDAILAVLIVGLLAAVAGPRAGRAVDAVRTDAAARRIAADLEYFRRAAITRSRDVDVTFTTAPAGYATADLTRRGSANQPWVVELDASGDAVLAADFNGGAALRFDYRGRPSAAGVPLSTASVLVGFGRYRRTLAIAPETGRVTLVTQ